MPDHAFDPETILRERPEDLRAYAAEIQTIQARLGTPGELPGDIDSLQQVAHKYMNLLQEYFGARQLSAPPFITAYRKAHEHTGS